MVRNPLEMCPQSQTHPKWVLKIQDSSCHRVLIDAIQNMQKVNLFH